MKTKLNFFSLFLFLVFQAIVAQPTENSLLWKVSGNGLATDSYLFGTIHATCDASLPEKVRTAFDKTEQLALEMDLGDDSIQAKMMQLMLIPEGKIISDYLSDEEFNQLSKNLEGKLMGMNLQMLQNIKPLFISIMLIPSALGCPQQAYDMTLFQLAQSMQKPIFGLEEVEDQMAALDDIPIEDQVKELLDATENDLQKYRDELEKLMNLYQDENITAMMKTMEGEECTFAGSSVALLDERNQSWIPTIERMMKEKPSFFGFGALHLPGEKGVIQLLRDKGYSVVAVFN